MVEAFVAADTLEVLTTTFSAFVNGLGMYGEKAHVPCLLLAWGTAEWGLGWCSSDGQACRAIAC